MLVRRCGSRAASMASPTARPRPWPGGDALARGAIQELAGLARHAEETAVETRADVLRRAAAPRQLEVVHEARAVHGHGRQAPALDQVDDERPEPHLDGVRAHAEHDGPPRADRACDARGGVAQVARRQDVGQSGEELAHAGARAHGLAERPSRPPCSAAGRAAPCARAADRWGRADGRTSGSARVAGSRRLPADATLDQLAEHVSDEDVGLLDARREPCSPTRGG